MIYDPYNSNHFKFNYCIFLTPAFQTKNTDETNLNKTTRGFYFVIQILSSQFPVFQETQNRGRGVGFPRLSSERGLVYLCTLLFLVLEVEPVTRNIRRMGEGGIEVEGTFLPSPRVGRAEAESSRKQGRGWGPHTPSFQPNLAEPRTR